MPRYVVSQDIGLILGGRGLPHRFFSTLGITGGYEPLMKNTREGLESVLRDIFENLDYLDERELAQGFNARLANVRQKGEAVICLDRIYADYHLNEDDNHYALDVTRMYDTQGNATLRGRQHGVHGDMSLVDMVAHISAQMRAKGLTQATLADDVIFSGSSLIRTAQEFERHGIQITQAICCVAIDAGVRKLADGGIKVDSIKYYKDVQDQICERDFLCGVPHSGVLMSEGERMLKRPYMLPLGDPVARASIPAAHATAVSRKLLDISATFWDGLERLAGRPIMGADLPEMVALIHPNLRVSQSIRRAAACLVGVTCPSFKLSGLTPR